MCPGKENLFSFHLACAIFPTVIFIFHGEDVVFMGAKVQIFSIQVAFFLVHFHPYLLYGGLHLLAFDIDGYPTTLRVLFAITEVLAKMVQTSVTVRDGLRENAVVVFGCVFIFLNIATTIGMVTSGLPRSLNG